MHELADTVMAGRYVLERVDANPRPTRWSVDGPGLVCMLQRCSPSHSEAHMHSPHLIPRVILALTASLAGATCSDGIPTQASAPGPLSMITAHSPSHLKSSGTVGLASTPPAYTQLDAASAGGSGGALSLAVDVQGDIPRFPDSY